MLKASAAPLLVANINTDVIIRIERVANCPRGSLGPWAFEVLRFLDDGSENPEFVLNQPQFRSARILLAGPNFGCGSSREMAVWAIQELGIRCVIAQSFGDIFFNNCLQNGILPICLPEATVEALAAFAQMPGSTLTVDLAEQQVLMGDRAVNFEIAPLSREALLEGLDSIALIMRREAAISAFEARDLQLHPWLHSPSQHEPTTIEQEQ